MNHFINSKRLFYGCLSFFLLIGLLTGCGGDGGGKNETKGPNQSKDYFGLVAGRKLVYNTRNFVDEEPENGTETMTVSEVAGYTGLFEVLYETPGKPNYGEFYLKEGNRYYFSGYWNAELDARDKHDYTEFKFLILKNPIELTDVEGDYWGVVKGKENVTVPAGTFEAWVFEDISNMDKTWFVPNIGIIKIEESNKKDDITYVNYTIELVSYSF